MFGSGENGHEVHKALSGQKEHHAIKKRVNLIYPAIVKDFNVQGL